MAWAFILSYRASCILKLSVSDFLSCKMCSSRSFSSIATCFVRSYFLKTTNQLLLVLTLNRSHKRTYACKSENVDSSDAKWFAFNSLSLRKSLHFFSYVCTICSFSAISSEIAFSYASTTPLKRQT